jgi:hypothetical protein
MKYLLFFFFSFAFAQFPTYWGIGINAADNMDVPGENTFPFDTKNLGFIANIEFGQLFSPKIGYNIRFASVSFRKTTHQDLYYISGGINYNLHDFNFNANVIYGDFKSQIVFVLIDDSNDIVGVEIIKVKQNGAIGFEIGVNKKIIRSLWGQVYCHYTLLDKYKVHIDSLQYYGIGLKYIWGCH